MAKPKIYREVFPYVRIEFLCKYCGRYYVGDDRLTSEDDMFTRRIECEYCGKINTIQYIEETKETIHYVQNN